MTRRRARHMRRVGEHVPCRTRRCMRHGSSNANGHGMPCDEGFPISAASTDTVGRIPPTCQHPMLRVSAETRSSLNKVCPIFKVCPILLCRIGESRKNRGGNLCQNLRGSKFHRLSSILRGGRSTPTPVSFDTTPSGKVVRHGQSWPSRPSIPH